MNPMKVDFSPVYQKNAYLKVDALIAANSEADEQVASDSLDAESIPSEESDDLFERLEELEKHIDQITEQSKSDL